jgi:hypothetical protein
LAEKSANLRKPKISNLEMANQMFKDAWLVKRTWFASQFPKLSAKELDRKTADYFAKLKDS